MRRAFINAMVEIAERDERVLLLTADLGYMAVEPFRDRFPDRFLNVGVSEQNLIGVASGLAEAGYLPFAYSIGTFATLRPYEFIRNGPVLHGLPVRIVGIGGGMEYGHNGISHYPLEDLAVMRAQPGMTVLAPADAQQAAAALHASYTHAGPTYYRLGKDDRAVVPGLNGRFRLGRVESIRHGGDVLLVATGAAAVNALGAAEVLAASGVQAEVLVAASIAPAPVADLARMLRRHVLAVTVESHYLTGGLGSLVAETIAERGLRSTLVRCGVDAMPTELTGSQAFMEEWAGLSPAAIAAKTLSALERRASRRPSHLSVEVQETRVRP